jgi:N-acetyl sugar amidotransferase
MPSYCRECILPDTRPGVALDAEGVCNGCRNARAKRAIDWAGRSRELDSVVQEARSRSGEWDCVIPVSGGKDSFWQVASCLERGLRPLCVTYVYPGQTELGRRNLRSLIAMGVDHLELRLDPVVERALVRKAFQKTAISGLVTHMAIYTMPIRVALERGIPLVVYGENSAFEYGSEEAGLDGADVTRQWLKRFGVTAGTTAEDWVDETLTRADLEPLVLPQDALEDRDLRVIFLGHYLPWDPQTSREVAVNHGFSARPEGARVGHYDFVNIDDDMIGAHHYPKWHKFGITRSWDTLSMEIRAGRMTRDEAIDALRAKGDETPWADIESFCAYTGMTVADYLATVERFRHPDLWSRVRSADGSERWAIEGFLIEDFPWPADVSPR